MMMALMNNAVAVDELPPKREDIDTDAEFYAIYRCFDGEKPARFASLKQAEAAAANSARRTPNAQLVVMRAVMLITAGGVKIKKRSFQNSGESSGDKSKT
jgi:hypothetical protein